MLASKRGGSDKGYVFIMSVTSSLLQATLIYYIILYPKLSNIY